MKRWFKFALNDLSQIIMELYAMKKLALLNNVNLINPIFFSYSYSETGNVVNYLHWLFIMLLCTFTTVDFVVLSLVPCQINLVCTCHLSITIMVLSQLAGYWLFERYLLVFVIFLLLLWLLIILCLFFRGCNIVTSLWHWNRAAQPTESLIDESLWRGKPCKCSLGVFW